MCSIDILAAYTSLHGSAFLTLVLSRPSPPWYATKAIRHGGEPEEVYFWWRTYSYAMGDTDLRWRLKPFDLVVGSGIRLAPPPLPDQANAMTPGLRAGWRRVERRLTKPTLKR